MRQLDIYEFIEFLDSLTDRKSEADLAEEANVAFNTAAEEEPFPAVRQIVKDMLMAAYKNNDIQGVTALLGAAAMYDIELE